MGARDFVIRVAGLGLLVGCMVAVAFTVFTVQRPTVELAPLEEKSFGFFDPHLHVGVVSVKHLYGPGQVILVRVRVRNDAADISVDPSPLKIVALDDEDREHTPREPSALPIRARLSVRFDQEVAAGEARTGNFLFFLPEGTENPRLWVTYPTWWMRWIPDHENGFGRRRLVFSLDETREEGV